MNYALIFAGGVGSRMGSAIPKQFLKVDDKPIIIHVIEKFAYHPEIDGIVIVCKEEYIENCQKYIREYNVPKVMQILPGGNNGQGSIRNGLQYLVNHSNDTSKDIVLIHDGVRPLITEDLITRSISCVKANGNSIAVASAIETVIIVDENGKIMDTVDRSRCRNAKAPQCFYLNDIWETHQKAVSDGNLNMIDSATLMSLYGFELFTTDCSQENIKITTPNDYYMFKGIYEHMFDHNEEL